jgi:hypothetical protein
VVCVSTTLVTPSAKSWAIAGGRNAEEPPPLAFHLEILPIITLELHSLGYLPDVSASNDSGAPQAGVLPSVPGGMTVGATPSGVPPGVSASNGFEAPQPGVSPVSLVA